MQGITARIVVLLSCWFEIVRSECNRERSHDSCEVMTHVRDQDEEPGWES